MSLANDKFGKSQLDPKTRVANIRHPSTVKKLHFFVASSTLSHLFSFHKEWKCEKSRHQESHFFNIAHGVTCAYVTFQENHEYHKLFYGIETLAIYYLPSNNMIYINRNYDVAYNYRVSHQTKGK